MGWECRNLDVNAGKVRNQGEKWGNLGNQGKNVGNQGSDAENSDGNLGIAVEMAQNNSDKFKEWGEVKTIENEHICKNLVSHI